jgi:protease I
LILTDENFEDMELFVPYYRLNEEGFDVEVASKRRGVLKGKHGYEIEATKAYDEIKPENYDMLFLPGGKAPSKVRREEAALSIVRHFMQNDKPVAAICHGPQILISAGVVMGRRLTCWPGVANELREAGAIYEDREAIVDGNLVTSRMPKDLPYFLRHVMRAAKASIRT